MPYGDEHLPRQKAFPVGETSVVLSPPSFEQYMELQAWMRTNQKENATPEQQEYLGTGYSVQCIYACTDESITPNLALQVYLLSGGPLGEVVTAAIKLCTVQKPVAKETLEAIPTSSPEK